ncbi:MAG: hypothetical protein CL928_02995 [Deltaproteobacteria bacterium]|nr:hypothetical protein [Deltaproteobacteria bacterium]
MLPLLLLFGCSAYLKGVPDAPRNAESRSQRDASPQFSPPVVARFLRAQVLLTSKGEGRPASVRVAEALQLLQQTVALEPRQPLLWRYLARAHSLVPDPEQAVIAAKRAVALDQSDPEAHYLLGEQLHRMGLYREAERALHEAVKLGVSGDSAHLPHYYLYLVRKDDGRVDDALEALESWRTAVPNDSKPLRLRTDLLWEVGRVEEARDAAIDSLAIDPDDTAVQGVLLAYYENDPLAATEVLDQLVRSHWTSVALHRELVDLYETMGRHDLSLYHLGFVSLLDDRHGMRSLLRRGRLLLQMHDFEGVLELVQTALEAADQQNAELVGLLAEALDGVGRTDEAIAVLRELSQDQRVRVDALSWMAELLLRRHRFDAAMLPLQDALAFVDEADTERRLRLLWLVASAMLRAGQVEEAQRSVVEAAALAPAYATQLQLSVLRTLGSLEDALVVAQRAVEQSPEDLQLLGQYVELLQLTGRSGKALLRMEEALESIELWRDKALKSRPVAQHYGVQQEADRKRVFLLFRRSFLERRDGDVEGCAGTLREILALQPSNAEALNALAYLWAEEGRNLEEGFELVQRALEQQPYSGAFQDTLGWLLFGAGRLDEAVDVLLLASQYRQDNAEILSHLAEAYRASGHLDKARSTYEAALEALEPTERELEVQIRARFRMFTAQ